MAAEVRSFVADWPDILVKRTALEVRPESGRDRSEVRGAIDLMRKKPPVGEIIVLYVPHRFVDISDVDQLLRAWTDDLRRQPLDEVSFAVALADIPGRLHDVFLRLWEQGRAFHSTKLAFMSSEGPGSRVVHVDGPFRGRSVRRVQSLFEIPVVSAEILAALAGENEAAPADRWSNRIAALRRSGLLVPLQSYDAESPAVRRAHTEVIGRKVDKRPFRLYRSVLYDLVRWEAE